jgi:CRP-like cAMP-binding protein
MSEENFFLASLSPQDHDALSPHLKDIVLPQGMVLYRAGDEIERIYFPHTGIVSFVVVLLSGEAVEAGMFGKNSLVGTSAALDGPVALNQAVIQSAGTGSYVETSIFKRLAADSPSPDAGCASRADDDRSHAAGRSL